MADLNLLLSRIFWLFYRAMKMENIYLFLINLKIINKSYKKISISLRPVQSFFFWVER
jgi:hypothetical protein